MAWYILIRKVAITNAYECEALCVCVIYPTSGTPSAAPRQFILTMPPKKVYYCNCQHYCDGHIRVVKKMTYFNHAKYCNARSQFSPQFLDYLNKNPPVLHSSAYNDLKRSRRRVSGTRGGPRAERVHLSPGDHNDEHDSVGAFPCAHIRRC